MCERTFKHGPKQRGGMGVLFFGCRFEPDREIASAGNLSASRVTYGHLIRIETRQSESLFKSPDNRQIGDAYVVMKLVIKWIKLRSRD